MKNIGFCRFGLPIELYLNTASINTLGTEIRSGLLYSLLKEKYKITILSEIKKKDKILMRNNTLIEDENSWIKKIKYDPAKKTIDDIDILFIEQGPTNTLYSGKYGSHVENTLKIINNFSGKVIYWQHGNNSFPFGEAFYTDNVKKSTSELNLKSMFKKIDGENGIFNNKSWKIITHAQNVEKFIEDNGSSTKKRCMYQYVYDNNLVDFEYIPLCYSDIDPYFPILKNPEWDALWIGGVFDSNKKSGNKNTSRIEQIKKYYDLKNHKSVIIGYWPDKYREQTKNIKFLGQLGSHGDAYKFWNNSYACIWTTSNLTKEWGLVPSRPIMAILGGALCLGDQDIYNIDNIINKEFIVSSKKEVEEYITYLKNSSIEEREKLRKLQLDKFKKWNELNWEKIFK